MKTARHLWVLPLIVTCYLYHTVQCSRFERCSAEDGLSGVCVLKRFCRVASTFPGRQQTRCPGAGDLVCCPLPSDRNSETHVATPGSVQPSSTENWQNPKVTKPNLSLTTSGGDGKPPPASHPRDEPYRRPQHSRESTNRPIAQPTPKSDGRLTSLEPNHGKGTISNAERGQKEGQPKRRPTRLQIPEHARGESSHVRGQSLQSHHNSTDSIRFTGPSPLPHPPAPACGEKPYKLFIAGGEESNEHEWPWMAAIFRRRQGGGPKSFICGGSLINSRYILSAAHCFVRNSVVLPASLFLVRLGAHNLNQGEEYAVGNVAVHLNHSGVGYYNDIALIRLSTEVYFTDKIAPICLPSPEMATKSFIGRTATVAGWGETAFRRGGSQVLRHVVVPVVSGEDCSAAYSRVGGAAFLARGTDNVVCAGLTTGGKDACLGDSGGPLMLKMKNDLWTVIGIVSLGYKCAEPDYPGVYTRVTHYLTWIFSNMKKY